MKSKLIIVAFVFLLTTAVWQAPSVLPQATSFKEELMHLVVLRDGGLISQREYKLLKQHVLNRMLR